MKQCRVNPYPESPDSACYTPLVTQPETVLHELERAPDGLTATELHERTNIEKNTLSTVIWELRRDGHIDRVGGVRGRYKYGITQKGRGHLPGAHLDPLTRLANSVRDHDMATDRDFQDFLKVIDNLSEYKTLRGFVNFLATDHPELLADEPDTADNLRRAVLEYMGVDASAFREQKVRLEALLSLVRST